MTGGGFGGCAIILAQASQADNIAKTVGDAFEKKLAELDTSKTNLPKDYALSPPRPNPFNTAVSFEVDLPRTSIVELKIYDILGRLVDVPIEGTEIPAGRFTETWRCESCPSGTYFAVLLTNNFHQTRKMMLVK